jgi:hypothetical protein
MEKAQKGAGQTSLKIAGTCKLRACASRFGAGVETAVVVQRRVELGVRVRVRVRVLCVKEWMRDLVNRHHFNVEDQVRVSGYAGYRLAAVSQFGWDGNATLAAYGHASDTNVPAFNNFTNAKLKAEWLAFLICFWRN